MIDPNNWRGPLTRENAHEIAGAFQHRLSSGNYDFTISARRERYILNEVKVTVTGVIIENREQILVISFSETQEIHFEPERIVVFWNNGHENKEWNFFPR